MTITFTVDPETITFTEWQDGEEVGSGDGRDIDLLRETGELLPELAALWDAMIVTVAEEDEPGLPTTPAGLLAAALRDRPLWDALLAELRRQVAADAA